MNILSPKIEIINHFDKLINQVDIDIEKCLERYKEEQVLSQLDCFGMRKRSENNFSLICFDPIKPSQKDIQYQTVDEFSESTKVVDYLNQIRKRTIDELTKAQKDTLEYYKLNSMQFKSNDNQLIEEKKMDEIRIEMFKEKFYFQVLYKTKYPKFVDPWIFNLFTFITDFYISSIDIALLEILINTSKVNVKESNLIFDEKMVLIGLLEKHFYDNLNTQKFPSHVIFVRKEDLLNIQEIMCNCISIVNLSAATIDLSNLEKLHLKGKTAETIKIEGLSSLKYLSLSFYSLNQVILSNQFSLRELELHLDEPINSDVLKLTDNLPNIEMLCLGGKLSHFSLDSLSNLRQLFLIRTIYDEVNFGLFDSLCTQLEEILIAGSYTDEKFLNKLLYGRNFPYLREFWISDSSLIKLEKKLFNGFPMLNELIIYNNKELRIIDHDAFSNLTQLKELCLDSNCIESIDKRLFSNLINLTRLYLFKNRIEAIEENCFSNLHKLEYLDLSENLLTYLDPNLFVGLKNLKILHLNNNKLTGFDLSILDNIRKIEEIDLSENPIINKEDLKSKILNLSWSSLIKFFL